MSLTTFSTFYFGHIVTAENNLIDFDEGFGPLIAEINVGTYSLTDFVIAIRDAMNNAGTLTYVISLDRSTREITIASTAPFDLLVNSGASVGTSAWSLMGFSGADRTGLLTYTGNLPSGLRYDPQFILQSHVPKENFKRTVSASVNESASGEVEVVRFGSLRFTQFDIKFITNLRTDGRLIKYDPSGVDNANVFMNYITQVVPIEFMPDIDDPNDYQTIQIEQTSESKDGIDYLLKELFDRGAPGVYETGILKFRVLD